MITEKHIPIHINADDDYRFLKPDEAVNLENCRVGLSLNGKDNRIENIRSTNPIANSFLSSGVNTIIGSTIDSSRRRIIFFCYNDSTNHCIYAYDIPSKSFYVLLTNAQVTGGLNFSLNYYINRNASVIGDLLIFTENYNEPRCLNIEAAIKLNNSGYSTTTPAYTSPLRYESLTLIKKPPINVLGVVKSYNSGFTNNLTKNSSFQFSYRYTYKYGQVSAIAEYSKLIYANAANDTFNYVAMTVSAAEQIDDEVQRIDLCVRYGNTGKTFIIKSYDKKNSADSALITAHNAGTPLTYNFYNNVGGIALDDVSSINYSDYVPLLSGTLEIAKDRLFLGNNLSGYDSPAATSLALTYADTSTPNTNIPLTTATSTIAGFNTATTIPLTVVGAPLTGTNYRIRSQGYNNIISLNIVNRGYPSYPAVTNDSLFENTSSSASVYFSFSGSAMFYNGSNDTTVSIWAIISSSPNTEKLVKICGTTLTKGINKIVAVNFNYNVPPLTKIWLIMNPDNGITGFNDNNLTMVSSRIYVDNTTFTFGAPIFKTGGSYKAGIAFFDRFKRKTGIVTNTSVIANIPNRNNTSNPSNTLAWGLSNTNRLTEIPTDAYYYQVYLTKNINASSFIQFVPYDIRYGKKDKITGVYVYEDDTYTNDADCTAVNIKNITDISLGYVFNEGDVVYLVNSSNVGYTLKINSVDGNWLQCEKKDIGQGGNSSAWVAEIYTPAKDNINDNYYTASPVMAVTSPVGSSRAYSTLSGALQGDTYFIQRYIGTSVFYKAEAMNPNDRNWSIWDRDLGSINLVDTIGQQRKPNTIQFSDTFIQGTKVNGLSKFQLLNQKSVSGDSGSIQKLILTNKQGQQLGVVMLCICQNEPLSIYLGETQLVSQEGNAFIAQSSGVIGSINALKGNYGTMHPESVVGYLGDIFWWDAVHGSWIQYSNNGAIPINYKLNSYFTKLGKSYLGNGYTSRVVSGIDASLNQLICAMPTTESSAPYQLPSYSGVPSYATTLDSKFSFYDGKAKTLYFDIATNQWKYSVRTINYLIPEWIEFVENEVYSFLGGTMYQHESGSGYNNLWGDNAPARVVIPANKNVSAVKDLYSVAVEGNSVPNYTVAYVDYPYEQITDLANSDFDQNGNNLWQTQDGVQYASFLKDRLSPNVSGSAEMKMFCGDLLRGVTPIVMIEFQKYDAPLIVNFIDINYEVSKGHKEIINVQN